MSDEQNKNQNQTETPEAVGTREKFSDSPLMKYIIFGVGGIALVLVIAFGTAFLMKKDAPVQTDTSHEIVSAADKAGSHAGASGQHGDVDGGKATGHQQDVAAKRAAEAQFDGALLEEEADYGAIEKIMDNLAFLDYEPDDSEIGEEEGMSNEDSLAAVNWLDQEKASLALRKKELDTRERRLNKLEQEVNRKMLKIEQVESVRVSKLARLYDGMDPRSVTKLMANLDDNTVVELLPKMKVKNASSVLALMPAQRAARLSKQMITIAEN